MRKWFPEMRAKIIFYIKDKLQHTGRILIYKPRASNILVADFCPYITSFTGPMAPTKQQKLRLFYVLLLSVVVAVIPYIHSTMFPNP